MHSTPNHILTWAHLSVASPSQKHTAEAVPAARATRLSVGEPPLRVHSPQQRATLDPSEHTCTPRSNCLPLQLTCRALPLSPPQPPVAARREPAHTCVLEERRTVIVAGCRSTKPAIFPRVSERRRGDFPVSWSQQAAAEVVGRGLRTSMQARKAFAKRRRPPPKCARSSSHSCPISGSAE